MYNQRCEEHDKAKHVTVKAEEEQQSTSSSTATKTLDKKRRLEEEAKNKVRGARRMSLAILGWSSPLVSLEGQRRSGPLSGPCHGAVLTSRCPLGLSGRGGAGHVPDLHR